MTTIATKGDQGRIDRFWGMSFSAGIVLARVIECPTAACHIVAWHDASTHRRRLGTLSGPRSPVDRTTVVHPTSAPGGETDGR